MSANHTSGGSLFGDERLCAAIGKSNFLNHLTNKIILPLELRARPCADCFAVKNPIAVADIVSNVACCADLVLLITVMDREFQRKSNMSRFNAYDRI